jgi:TolA-binding protein
VTLLLAGASSGWCQQNYLYTPKPVAPEEQVQKGAGIMVREVQVQKGDTLYGLSRTFSGRGSYYPQILLFNDIKDPDRIYAGDMLRLPVSPDHAPAHTARSTGSASKRTAVPVPEASHAQKAPVKAAAVVKHSKVVKQPAAAVDANAGQKLFERAVKAYRQEDYRTALELFDRFLVENPASALAADADLYKAECYLKQSGQ